MPAWCAVLAAIGLSGCFAGGPAHAAPNAIVLENQRPGDAGWKLTHESQDVKGYGVPFSVTPGHAVDVRVSTPDPAFTVKVYRLGWYGGLGGRLLAALGPFQGTSQGGFHRENSTGLVWYEWAPTFRIPVATNWTTGVYVAKLNTSRGNQNYVPFVVRPVSPDGQLLFHTSEFTWQAYNLYGGTSLYHSNVSGRERGYKVSMDRPFEGPGWGHFGFWELPMLRFLEKHGYDVDYAADVDIHEDSSLLRHYRGILTVGHDEYWTKAMRDQFDGARDAGVNLAFFGANIGYWQVRLEPSRLGDQAADRILACYKDQTLDPRATLDPSSATVQFRQSPLNRPERDLIGVQYVAYAKSNAYVNETFTADAARVFLAGPSPGTIVPKIVGYEWDAARPRAGLRILATATPIDINGNVSHQDATIYRAPGGAFVYGAGTMGWSLGLEAWTGAWGTSRASPAVQNLTAAIVQLMRGDSSVLSGKAGF